MTATQRIAGAPGSALAAASRRGDMRPDAGVGTGFRAALVDAVGASNAASAVASGGDRARHVVKAGETLYGIARARLAEAGEAATPAAAMRLARQIATDNGIRDPDRILAGRQLDLGTARSAGPNVVRDLAETGVSPSVDRPERSAAAVRWDDEHLHAAAADDPQAAHAMTGSSPAAPIRADAAVVRTAHDSRPSTGGPGSMPAPMPMPIAAPAPAAGGLPSPAALAIYAQIEAAPGVPYAQAQASALPDIVYKGVVGKALDLLPLDPSTRTGLQQASTVIGSSMVGKSLAALTGLGGPVLTVAGLVWGIFSAQKIGAMQAAVPQPAGPEPAQAAIRVAQAPRDAIGD